MLGGALIPGKPVANMYFTMYGYNPVVQALNLLRDLKLVSFAVILSRSYCWWTNVGSVYKASPKSDFYRADYRHHHRTPTISFGQCSLSHIPTPGRTSQLYHHEGTCFFAPGKTNWRLLWQTVLSAQRDVLKSVQGTNVWSGQQVGQLWSHFTSDLAKSRQVQSYNSAAIAWGALGKPLYATGTRYGFVPYMLLVGLGFPVPFWLLHKKYPSFGFNYVFTPILVGELPCLCCPLHWLKCKLAELGFLSVGINSSVFTSFLLAIFSQYYLRK